MATMPYRTTSKHGGFCRAFPAGDTFPLSMNANRQQTEIGKPTTAVCITDAIYKLYIKQVSVNKDLGELFKNQQF